MNSLWDIRIFLCLEPKESHCSLLAEDEEFANEPGLVESVEVSVRALYLPSHRLSSNL